MSDIWNLEKYKVEGKNKYSDMVDKNVYFDFKKKINDIYDRVYFLRWWYPKLVADFDYEKESFWIKLQPEFISTVEHNWRQEKWIKKPY